MVLDEDLDIIASDIKDNDIKNSKIVITGATGLLGSLMAKGFLRANEKFGLKNKIYVLARNEEKARSVFAGFESKSLIFVKNEITEPIEIQEKVDYVFHTAAVTKSKEMVTFPVELIQTAVNGTINVLDFAMKKKAKSIVYLSSMEMYGVIQKSNKLLKENDLGYVDLTKVRSCYPESKRLIENYCKCCAEEFGLNVTIARLTQTFGAGASYDESRIFGMIARSAIEKKDIVLQTSGKSTHDYCYTTDAINAILTIATKGQKGEAYNIANPKTNKSIKDMAQLVAKEFGEGQVKVKVATPKTSEKNCFGAESVIKLNVDKLRDLGWNPRYDLKDIYGRLIASYREILDTKAKEGEKNFEKN